MTIVKSARDWSVYIARCRDGSLYTGIAKDVVARLAAHNAGRGAAYTRARRPVRLAHREDGFTKPAALSREAAIKSLTRPEKLALLKTARRAAAAVLLLLAALPARAVPAFTKENPVVLSSAAPQAFTYTSAAGFTYPIRMYFIRKSSEIEVGSASSADGVAWTEDAAGGRLSTATTPSVSASSITGCAVLPLSGGGDRMVYAIVSTTGSYRLHSATSTDGLNWANDTGTVLNSLSTPVSAPALVKLSGGDWRLYYLSGATPNSATIMTMLSTNEGLNWGSPSVALSTPAFDLSAAVLTNNKVRLFFSQPLVGVSSGGVVSSALSTDTNGASFTAESGLRLSTAAASGTLSDPVPVRSTDSFRWRLYYDFADPGTLSTASVHTALTGAPDPQSVSPSTILNVNSTQTFTISGEVFGSASVPTVKLSMSGQADITGTSVSRTDDQTLTASFDVLNQTVGLWDLTVTNPDGTSTTLSNALLIDFPGGSLGMVNNLLRPRLGSPTTIHITTFNDGRVVAKLYTVDGRPVRTLYDGDRAKGTLSLTWDGNDASGAAVASGVYLLSVSAPKLHVKGKIVVIR